MASLPQGAFAACKLRQKDPADMKVSRLPKHGGNEDAKSHYANKKLMEYTPVKYNGKLMNRLVWRSVQYSEPVLVRSSISLSVSASGANTISIHRIISKRVATPDSSKSTASSRTSEYSIVYRLRTGSQFQVDPVNMKLTSNVRARLIAGSETPLLIINWAAAIVPVRVSSFALDRNLICKITLY